MSNTDAPFAAHAHAEYGAFQHVGLVLAPADRTARPLRLDIGLCG